MRPLSNSNFGICIRNPWLLRLATFWLILFLGLTSCSTPDDAYLIRQLIKEGAKLAEEHDTIGLMKLTTEDFLARPGQHDRRGVRRILWLAFNHYRDFRLMYPEPSVDLAGSGSEALATVYFLIAKKQQSIPKLEKLYKNPQDWLVEVGENADLYRLRLELSKKSGDWLVSRALLEPFRGLGFSG